MRTEDLIAAISADAATKPRRLTSAFRLALGVAALGAGATFFAMLGVRPDAAKALGTIRFPLKFVVTIAFALAAGALALELARPGADRRPGRIALACAAALLGTAVAVELAMTPSASWETRLVGTNWLVCLGAVPTLSVIPLAAFLWAFRNGAPERPAALGAVAGLLSGALGATFYAAHCPDDSPLFVATWYTLGVAAVSAAGAVLGAKLLRW